MFSHIYSPTPTLLAGLSNHHNWTKQILLFIYLRSSNILYPQQQSGRSEAFKSQCQQDTSHHHQGHVPEPRVSAQPSQVRALQSAPSSASVADTQMSCTQPKVSISKRRFSDWHPSFSPRLSSVVRLLRLSAAMFSDGRQTDHPVNEGPGCCTPASLSSGQLMVRRKVRRSW